MEIASLLQRWAILCSRQFLSDPSINRVWSLSAYPLIMKCVADVISIKNFDRSLLSLSTIFFNVFLSFIVSRSGLDRSWFLSSWSFTLHTWAGSRLCFLFHCCRNEKKHSCCILDSSLHSRDHLLSRRRRRLESTRRECEKERNWWWKKYKLLHVTAKCERVKPSSFFTSFRLRRWVSLALQTATWCAYYDVFSEFLWRFVQHFQHNNVSGFFFIICNFSSLLSLMHRSLKRISVPAFERTKKCSRNSRELAQVFRMWTVNYYILLSIFVYFKNIFKEITKLKIWWVWCVLGSVFFFGWFWCVCRWINPQTLNDFPVLVQFEFQWCESTDRFVNI